MLLQHSRRDARVATAAGAAARPGPVAGGTPTRSPRRSTLLRPLVDAPPAPYLLQALIAAEHAIAPSAEDTDWDRIAARYAELESLTGSPVVRLNRAVAVAEADGPEAGLALLDGLDAARPPAARRPGRAAGRAPGGPTEARDGVRRGHRPAAPTRPSGPT